MVASGIPRPGRAPEHGRLAPTLQPSMISSNKYSGMPLSHQTVPRTATPAAASQIGRRPSAPDTAYKRLHAASPMTRREPPAPRPAQAGRAFVGTTIPPPRHVRLENQNGHYNNVIPSRSAFLEPAKTPSLVSGSSISTLADSPRTNIGRLKEASAGSQLLSNQSVRPLVTKDAPQQTDDYPDAVFGISVPPTFPVVATTHASEMDILNLDQYSIQEPLSIPPLLSTTPFYALTATPSTRYSPGPFSVSSTPTSMSCYSPATISTAPTPALSINRHMSPVDTRSPNVRQKSSNSIAPRDYKAPVPARENSISSGSTVKASEDGARLRSPIDFESKAPSRLTRSKLRIGNEDRKPATLQKKPPSVPIRPPEFAHLADASPIKRSLTQRPERPSRDNTPDIGYKNAASVVQSNMSSLPAAASKPQSPSAPDRADTASTGSRGRFGLARKATARQPSPALSLSIPASRDKPENQQRAVNNHQSPAISSASASEEKPPSRFGLFRRGKSEPRLNIMSPEKRLRKAPMAGSGHEIYSKFGLRNRSGSTTSGNTSAERSSSTGSNTIGVSQPGSRKSSVGSKRASGPDDFVAQRLSPVTLRGAGAVNSRLDAASSSNTSSMAVTSSTLSIDAVSSLATADTSQTALNRFETSDTSLQSSSADVREPESNTSHADQFRLLQYSLSLPAGTRKSLVASSSSTPTEEGPGSTFHFTSHPAVNPLARKMSEPAPDVSTIDLTKISTRPLSGAQHTTLTPRLTRKWNFPWTNRTPTRVDTDTTVDLESAPRPALLPPRQVGHYAIQDVPRTINVYEIEKIMQEAETLDDGDGMPTESDSYRQMVTAPLPDSVLRSQTAPANVHFDSALRHGVSDVEPRASSDQAASLVKARNHNETSQMDMESVPKARPSRLQQVGRIPRVVSKRDRDRKLPVASFSRPFDAAQPSPASNSPVISNGTFSNPLLHSSFPRDVANATQSQSSQAVVTCMLPETTALTASPKMMDANNDERKSPSTRSTNTSRRSSMAPYIAPITIPGAHAVAGVDDIWHEYDDLMDLISAKTPKTPQTPHTGSSLGAPFHYAEYGASPVDAPQSPIYPTQRKSLPSVPSMIGRLRLPSVRDSATIRTSRSYTSAPASPVSTIGTFDSTLSRRASALAALTGRQSLPPASRISGGFPRMSLPSSVPEVSDEDEAAARTSKGLLHKKRDSKRDSINVQLTEARYMGFESMASLRASALSTSKWLSFGRTLFSPAHEELQHVSHDRVLVLDGLGKDWSFYLALCYKHITVYNLGSDPPDDAGAKRFVYGPPPPNHKHVHHPGLLTALPFANSFFSAVVFRFPAIASEAAYKFALGECKRVLRPGGYLEVSVLDMDLINMGNHGRRALRSLKERLHKDDPTVSFQPMSDSVLKLLGRRGFENLNRCVVGVPVAGSIPNAPSTLGQHNTASAGASNDISDQQNMPTIAELIRNHADSGDEGITRMVARVARWWYSRCYESLVLAQGDIHSSIWSNQALLAECEERETGLRLMVCFAQKPECAVRRTISV